MNEHRDLSRLPDDASYWADLEARVLAGLRAGERVPAEEGVEWWAQLGARAYTLGAFALAAAAAVLLLLPAPDPLDTPAGLLRPPRQDLAAIAPLSAESPPSLGRLVLPSPKE